MATVNSIKIQIGDEVIELVGQDKDNFISQQTTDNETMAAQTALQEAQEAAKLEVLNQLGLTNEQAILLGLLPPEKEELGL
jgi:hypothetical protein